MFVSKVNLLMAPFKKIAFDGRFWTWSIIILMNGLVGRILRRFLVLDPPGRELLLLGLEQGSPIWDPDFFSKTNSNPRPHIFGKKYQIPKNSVKYRKSPGSQIPDFVFQWFSGMSIKKKSQIQDSENESKNPRCRKWVQNPRFRLWIPNPSLNRGNPGILGFSADPWSGALAVAQTTRSYRSRSFW